MKDRAVSLCHNDVRTEKDMGKLLISVNYELLAATIGKNERTYSSP